MRRLLLLDDINKDHNALALLVLIARRARWHDGPNRHNLKIGEALVGDYKAIKLTWKEYRGALDRLERKWFQITTRRTNRGTIARLTGAAIFDLGNESGTSRAQIGSSKGQPKQPSSFIGETHPEQPTKGQPKGQPNGNQRAIKGQLTNKEIRKEGNNSSSKALPQSIAQLLSVTPVGLVFNRDDWLESLERLLGPKEWKQCGAMWRMRARGSPEDALALRNAIEDFFTRTPEQRNQINNRGAWLTDRYERNAKQLKKTRC
jgi:hypothetical protein